VNAAAVTYLLPAARAISQSTYHTKLVL